MKAILEFDLPEDQLDFEHATKAADYNFCLKKFDEYLRKEIKYNTDLNEIEKNTFDSIREKFNQLLTNNNIQL